MKFKAVIGLMSGTSMDGIDASLVYTNGDRLKRTSFNSITPYSDTTAALLNKAIENPLDFINNNKKCNQLSNLITIEHSKVIQKILDESKIIPFLVGFHGQTIYHEPSSKLSIQLGNGILLSRLIKINVVNNFRSNDIKFGGEGAPIAPIYHQKIIKYYNFKLPAVIINIGGIANLTYWDGNTLLGFDTGPGNNLMDFYMQKQFNKSYDNFGEFAFKGNINYELINNYSKNIFFSKKPPKSLERKYLFNNIYLENIYSLNKYDCMATLCTLTSVTIKKSIDLLPQNPKTIIIVGGGQHNKYLIKLIKESSTFSSVHTGNEVGLPSDFIEAELIALLSIRKYYNLPSTYPSTTGVKKDTILGDLIKHK